MSEMINAAGEQPSASENNASETPMPVTPETPQEQTVESTPAPELAAVPTEASEANVAAETEAPASAVEETDAVAPVEEVAPVEAEAPGDVAAPAAETEQVERASTSGGVHVVSSPAGPVVLTPEQLAAMQAEIEEQRRKMAEEKAKREAERAQRDAAFEELTKIKEANGTITVTFAERVKGGLRGEYNGLRLFLPASHLNAKKIAQEKELVEAVGKSLTVHISDLESDDAGHKSAIVSRKKIAEEEALNSVNIGDVVDGVVRQVLPFGIFVSVGELEGLAHVSKLSKSRIDTPEGVFQRGQKLKVTIVGIDKDKKRLSLSHKEHAPDIWESVPEKFPVGTIVNAVVKRFVEYGAYVQLAPGIQALLRNADLSWTQRSSVASESFAAEQTISVAVIEVDAKKQRMTVSHRITQANPWTTLTDDLPQGTEISGSVRQVSTQGAVVRIATPGSVEIDAFMPRSRFLGDVRAGKSAIQPGDTIPVVVMSVEPDRFSVIIAQKGDDGTIGGSDEDRSSRPQREGRDSRSPREGRGEGRGERFSGPRVEVPKEHAARGEGVTLGDLISEAQRSNLKKG